LDLGVNLFDTAQTYGKSESLLGEALRGVPRDRYLVSTKILPVHKGKIISAADARRKIESSLQELGVEELDILHLHRVHPEMYVEILDRLMPELEKLRSAGKVRYIGITESSLSDPHHRMLKRALQDDHFDTIMVAYSLANSCAEDEIFPLALMNDVGVMGMVAARHLVSRKIGDRIGLFSRTLAGFFSSPPTASKLIIRLRGALSVFQRSRVGTVTTVRRENGQETLVLPGAAYAFAASHPAIATVISGTLDPVHLQQNLEAILAPELTSKEIELLRQLLN
jgi:aryl-alcohol dehydrogenase-like predicted oxidoreductase